MADEPASIIAVIFSSTRTDRDEAGYRAAAAAMEERARSMPGYVGIESARGADGFGITISYWDDQASADRWRVDEAHRSIRRRGRDLWYRDYSVKVAQVRRTHRWSRS